MSHGLFYRCPCYVSGSGNMSVVLQSMEGQRALGFHQKYLNSCSEDERRYYAIVTTWGWVINDRVFIFGCTVSLNVQHTTSEKLLIFEITKTNTPYVDSSAPKLMNMLCNRPLLHHKWTRPLLVIGWKCVLVHFQQYFSETAFFFKSSELWKSNKILLSLCFSPDCKYNCHRRCMTLIPLECNGEKANGEGQFDYTRMG